MGEINSKNNSITKKIIYNIDDLHFALVIGFTIGLGSCCILYLLFL